MAVTTINGFSLELGFGPDLGGVTGGFVVALDAGVKLAAAFVLDGNDVALGVVMSTLGARVNAGAVDGNGLGCFHGLRVEPLDLKHAIDFFEALD